MAPSELTTMDPGELEHRLAESRKELFNLRFQLATGQLDNTARIGHVRKEIARILTTLRQQDIVPGEAEMAAVAAEAQAGGERAGDEAGGGSRRRRIRAGSAADAEGQAGSAGGEHDEDSEEEA